MEVASLILSVISLVLSIVAIVWLLSKQLSTHKIQMVPIDPLKEMGEPNQMGNNLFDAFRELGDPVDSDELEQLELLRQRKIK